MWEILWRNGSFSNNNSDWLYSLNVYLLRLLCELGILLTENTLLKCIGKAPIIKTITEVGSLATEYTVAQRVAKTKRKEIQVTGAQKRGQVSCQGRFSPRRSDTEDEA